MKKINIQTVMKRRERHLACMLVVLSLFWMPKMMAQTFEYPEDTEEMDKIAVKSQGSRPTITDFATAFLDHVKDREFYGKVNDAWKRHLQKKPLDSQAHIIVDTKNGYMRYEIINQAEKDTMVMEMCFWNCADGKHKMVCANTVWMLNGDYGWSEDIGACFYLYDNATKVMRQLYPEDIGALYDSDGLSVFFLPRKGKNIRVSAAGGGERWNEILEWDGYQFISKDEP